MRATAECYQCLERLVQRTIQLATADEKLRASALEQGREALQKGFSPQRIPTQIATEVQRVIRQVTGNKDPYRGVKDRELEMGARLSQEVRPLYGDDLRSLLAFSALGNAMDFFRGTEVVESVAKQTVTFAVDDRDKFVDRLQKAQKILLLADNAGECFFDLPLLKRLEDTADVLYVVKGSPVQDDLTLDDLRLAGLGQEVSCVITTGTDSPGLDLAQASDEFEEELASADLVIAKGMGYYETTSEFPIPEKVFHLLMAKCQPVASSLGIALNSYVACCSASRAWE